MIVKSVMSVFIFIMLALVIYVSTAPKSFAVPADQFIDLNQKQVGKIGNTAGKYLDTSQGVFSDLEIIFCNANYNPCRGTNDLDYMQGDSGGNIMVGMNGNDNITAYRGNDEIWGNEGNEIVGGGDGNDRIVGGDGDDVLYGEFDNDVILGGKGNDHLYGGPESWDSSDDIIAGGPGMDTIFGGPGNDKIYQNSEQAYSSSVRDYSKDRINCGAGHDEVWINTLDKDYAIHCEVIHKTTITSKLP
jgi:hypothetical protein